MEDEIKLYNGYRIQNTSDEYGQYNKINPPFQKKLDQFMIALRDKDVKTLFEMSELNKIYSNTQEYLPFCYGITYPETENHISNPKYLHQKDLKNIYDLLSPFTPVICCKLIREDESQSFPAYYRIDCSLTFTSDKNKLHFNGKEFNITAEHIETLSKKTIGEEEQYGVVKYLGAPKPPVIAGRFTHVVDGTYAKINPLVVSGNVSVQDTLDPYVVIHMPIVIKGKATITSTPASPVSTSASTPASTVKAEGEATITSTPATAASTVKAEGNVTIKPTTAAASTVKAEGDATITSTPATPATPVKAEGKVTITATATPATPVKAEGKVTITPTPATPATPVKAEGKVTITPANPHDELFGLLPTKKGELFGDLASDEFSALWKDFYQSEN